MYFPFFVNERDRIRKRTDIDFFSAQVSAFIIMLSFLIVSSYKVRSFFLESITL